VKYPGLLQKRTWRKMVEEIRDHPLAGRFNKLAPEDVLDVVESAGRRCTGRFIVLNSFENRVYQLELDDEEMVVGKFYRPGRWTREQILAEHEFLAELDDEEIPVSCPIELAPGETLGEVDGIFYSLFERVGGRAPEELDRSQLEMLGRFLARIHMVGARREAPARLRLTPEVYGTANLERLAELDAIHPQVRDQYVFTVDALLERIAPFMNAAPMQRIHGDCHLGNLIWSPSGATFLDFDDFLTGPPVQDVWLLVPSFDAEGQRQRDVLLEAYTELRDFDPSQLRLIEPLRALRFINYTTWIARRWDDPVFKRTFPHYGTIQYWEGEVLDLREQIARIDHALW